MSLYLLESVTPRELFPGFNSRLIHTPRLTHSFVEGTAGASFPLHQHPHEQVVTMLEGELELVVDGTAMRLTPGMVFAIPPDTPHSARAITNCRALDTFAPARDDYR